MKRVYERPMMFAQEFTANEYVAACGDSGKTYKFVCDAGDSRSDWEYGYKVFGNDGKQYGYNYRKCGKTHEADSDGFFIKGYMDDWQTREEEKIEVYIWTGENGDNCHCTTNVNMNSWETAKS